MTVTNSRSHTLRFTTKALETICSFLVVRTARITNRFPARRRKEMDSVMLPVFGDDRSCWVVVFFAPTSLICFTLFAGSPLRRIFLKYDLHLRHSLLHPHRWLPVEERIKYKTNCVALLYDHLCSSPHQRFRPFFRFALFKRGLHTQQLRFYAASV